MSEQYSAFPFKIDPECGYGMTLRAYIATHVSPEFIRLGEKVGLSIALAAEDAVNYADALIDELNKEKEK